MASNKQFGSANRPSAGRRQNIARAQHVVRDRRPVAAYRHRGWQPGVKLEDFSAPEVWHPAKDERQSRFVVQPAGQGFRHAVSVDEVRERLLQLGERFTRNLEVVQFSAMTRKREFFPCYGMQWGTAIYLYPIEDSLVEVYRRPPLPQQQIEARMYGGHWSYDDELWRLTWTEETIKDFYLNNVLIHEVGHLNDSRNGNNRDRERFANWFAIEFGYRPTRH
jgi:hypothetical protein